MAGAASAAPCLHAPPAPRRATAQLRGVALAPALRAAPPRLRPRLAAPPHAQSRERGGFASPHPEPRPKAPDAPAGYNFKKCRHGSDVLAQAAELLRDEKRADVVILGPVGISAAFSMLSKLPAPDGGYADSRDFAELVAGAYDLLPVMKPRALRTVLHSCFLLGEKLPPGFLERFWQASGATLHEFTGEELFDVFAACARKHSAPPPEWLDRFWHCSAAQMGLPIRPWCFVDAMFTISERRFAPPEAWMQHYWAATARAVLELTGRDCSDLIYGCSVMGLVPPKEVLDAFWEATYGGEVKLLTPQEQSYMLSALVKLGIAPPRGWLASFVQGTMNKLPKYEARELTLLLGACGALELRPPDDWLRRLWPALAAQAREFSALELRDALLVSCRMGGSTTSRDAKSLWRVAAESLRDLEPAELAETLAAFAAQQLKPGAEWLTRFWPAAVAAMPELGLEELKTLKQACAALNLAPPRAWLSALKREQAAARPVLTPAAAVLRACRTGADVLDAALQLLREQRAEPAFLLPVVLSRLAQLPQPRFSWADDDRFRWVLAALHVQLPALDAAALVRTLLACGCLRVALPDEWLARYWAAAALQLPSYAGAQAAITLRSCAKLGVRPPEECLQLLLRTSAAQMGGLSDDNVSGAFFALSKLGVEPPDDWLLRLWEVTGARMATFSTFDLALLVHVCGECRADPSPDWLDRFWAASAELLPEFTPVELATTLQGHGRLQVQPPAAWAARLWAACEDALPDFGTWELSSVLYAAAALAQWDTPALRAVWGRAVELLEEQHGDGSWGDAEAASAMQMYQVFRLAQAERPGALAPPSLLLLDTARNAWVRMARAAAEAQLTQFHTSVSCALDKLQLKHVNERWCERAERSIDIAVEGRGLRIALEADGPHHFLRSGRIDGHTEMRNRHLAANGWRVVAVDWRKWAAFSDAQARERFLMTLLVEAQRTRAPAAAH